MSCFRALVADFAAAAIFGLLNRVASQQTKRDRRIARQRHLTKRLTDDRIDVLIVRCLTFDNNSQSNHCIRLGQDTFDNDRNLPGARHPNNSDLRIGDACCVKRFDRPLQQPTRDRFVVGGYNDGETVFTYVTRLTVDDTAGEIVKKIFGLLVFVFQNLHALYYDLPSRQSFNGKPNATVFFTRSRLRLAVKHLASGYVLLANRKINEQLNPAGLNAHQKFCIRFVFLQTTNQHLHRVRRVHVA